MLIPRLFVRGKHGGNEARSADFTADLIQSAWDAATGKPVRAAELAAAQFAAGFVGRSLAGAEIDGTDALDPQMRQLVGQALIVRGEQSFLIDIRGGRIVLDPAIIRHVYGGRNPDQWIYDLELPTPDGAIGYRAPAAAVVHAMFAPMPGKPWRGRSPLAAACTSVDLAAAMEEKLLAEIKNTRQRYILPTPLGGDELTNFRNDLAGSDGGIMTAPTMQSGYGAGRANAPAADYQQIRLGPEPPAAMLSHLPRAGQMVLEAIGIAPGLLSAADGASAREAWRQAHIALCGPLASMLAAELSKKLERPIRIRLNPHGPSDTQARGRAFDSLAKHGIEPERALRLAGFDG